MRERDRERKIKEREKGREGGRESFVLFVWFVGFSTSSSTTRLYRGRATRQRV